MRPASGQPCKERRLCETDTGVCAWGGGWGLGEAGGVAYPSRLPSGRVGLVGGGGGGVAPPSRAQTGGGGGGVGVGVGMGHMPPAKMHLRFCSTWGFVKLTAQLVKRDSELRKTSPRQAKSLR